MTAASALLDDLGPPARVAAASRGWLAQLELDESTPDDTSHSTD